MVVRCWIKLPPCTLQKKTTRRLFWVVMWPSLQLDTLDKNSKGGLYK